MNQYQEAKTQGVDARYANAGIGAVLGGSPPRDVPTADTLTGQMMHLDDLIKGIQDILSRVSKLADALAPDNTDASAGTFGQLNKIAPGPETGPLLFRLQNRTSELYNLQSAIHHQINRIDQVL